MRISRSRRGTGSPSNSSSPRTGTTLLPLAFSLIAAFALGFLAHQQGWHAAVLRWGPVFVQSPRAVVATWRARTGLPVVTMDMRFADYQRLLTLRERALQLGVHVPAEAEAVAATVVFGSGEHQTVEVRLPGGPATRLQGETWPIELRRKDDSAWMRLTPVDETRAEFAWQQWGYLESLRSEGFSAATQTSVRLRFNGSDQGIYMLETPAADDMLVGFDARAAWEAFAAGEIPFEGGFRYALATAADNPTIVLSPATRAAAAQLRAVHVGAATLSEVSEAEDLGRFLALTALWTGAPAPDWLSLRWHYDPTTQKLSPVGMGQPRTDPIPLPEAFLDDPAVQSAYARALAAFSSPAYLEQLRRDRGAALEQQWLILGASTSTTPWSLLETHQRSMRARLAPAKTLETALEADREGFVLHLTNLQNFPVMVMGLDAGGAAMHALDPAWVFPEDRAGIVEDGDTLVLRAARGSLPIAVRLRLPRNLTSVRGDALYVVCRLWNAPTPELRVPIVELAPDPEAAP